MQGDKLTVGIKVFSSPEAGWAGLAATERGLLAVVWNRGSRREALDDLRRGLPVPAEKLQIVDPDPRTDIYRILRQAAEALLAFFSGDVKKVEKVPLDLSKATEWQQKVYHTVRMIPPGETLSYGKVAVLCGRSGGGRAVGQAMAGNPLPIFIPCHRVIRGDGSLGDYGCGGSPVKEKLLRLERLAAGASRYSS